MISQSRPNDPKSVPIQMRLGDCASQFYSHIFLKRSNKLWIQKSEMWKNYLFQMKYVGLLLWAQVLEVDIFMHGWMEESIWKERVYEIWADIYVDCRIWVAWNMGAWIDGWKDRLMNEPNEDQPPPLSSWPGVHIFGHTKAAPRLWDSRFRSISFSDFILFCASHLIISMFVL